jgi:hypothetical protein
MRLVPQRSSGSNCIV